MIYIFLGIGVTHSTSIWVATFDRVFQLIQVATTVVTDEMVYILPFS